MIGRTNLSCSVVRHDWLLEVLNSIKAPSQLMLCVAGQPASLVEFYARAWRGRGSVCDELEFYFRVTYSLSPLLYCLSIQVPGPRTSGHTLVLHG